MRFDPHLNWIRSTVAGAPSPALSGTALTLAAGEGALFPATTAGSNSYNLVAWPDGVPLSRTNSEIIRVDSRSTDVLSSIQRAQEGSTAKAIAIGWQVALVPTAKTYTDIELASLGGNALTPTALSTNQNDYSPTGWSTALYNRLRLASSGAIRTVTGVVPTVPASLGGEESGRTLTIENVGALDLVLAYYSASSAAANRFIWASTQDMTIPSNGSATFIYDDVGGGWRLVKDVILTAFSIANRTRYLPSIPAKAFDLRDGSPAYAIRGANTFYYAWDFDAASSETVIANVEPPADYVSGAITIDLSWTNLGGGSGNVVWQAFINATADTGDYNSLGGLVSGTAVTVAAPAQNVKKVTTLTITHTPAASPSSFELAIRRVGGDAGDTLGNDAGLVSVRISYTADT